MKKSFWNVFLLIFNFITSFLLGKKHVHKLFQAEPTWKNGGPLGWQLQINQATGLMPEVVSGNTHAAYLWRLKMNRLLVLPWLYLKGSYYSMIDKELKNVYGSIQPLAGKDSYIILIGVIYFSLKNSEEG